jgi:hypothetical protein
MWCCILWGIGWWLVAAVLVSLCWNVVVSALVTVKQMKLWHALLIVLMVAILFGPMICASKCSSGGSSCPPGYEHCSPDSCGR